MVVLTCSRVVGDQVGGGDHRLCDGHGRTGIPPLRGYQLRGGARKSVVLRIASPDRLRHDAALCSGADRRGDRTGWMPIASILWLVR
jgi:hypothetical protein